MSGHSLRSLLRGTDDGQIRALHQRWLGRGSEIESSARALAALTAAMGREELVQGRLKELSEKLGDLAERFLAAPARSCGMRGILETAAGAFRSRYELHASLVALAREGFVFPVPNRESFEDGAADDELWAMPEELGSCIDGLRHRQQVELSGTLSLKGFLQERYYKQDAQQRDGSERGGSHGRRVYKIYLMESSIRNRIAALAEPIRRVFDRILTSYGGVMPAGELPRIAAEEEVDVDLAFLQRSLEEAMLGTVAPLRLARFGLEPIDPAVVVFYEITLHCLQDWSDDREAPETGIDESLSSGVDLVTNLGRFLRDVATTKVQFTVDGNLYKASARRIVKNFLDVPGGYMPPETQARFIYGYCLGRRLVERSGERALRLSSEALDFEHRPLREKLRALLSYVVEERAPQGEHFHQVRLRRILLRLLRRLEPEQWYEALFVPFLARNGYLGKLDDLRVEEFFAARFKGGGYVPSDSAHQICLHLLDFVKRRLYPLGLVDLGLREGRPVALRLSRLGAELLGAEAAGELGGQRSSTVVNPDFEIILFPGEDEHEAVHALDQFCERLKTDHIHHFRIGRDSVQAALNEGVTLQHIVQELTDRSRAPLPQNVLFSLEDWADQAGVLVYDEHSTLRGRKAEVLDRFAAHPRLAEWVLARREPERLALRPDTDFAELRDVARDLGFLIERDESASA